MLLFMGDYETKSAKNLWKNCSLQSSGNAMKKMPKIVPI